MNKRTNKWILAAALALCSFGNAMAEQPESDWKSEIGFSYGFMSDFSWLGPYTDRGDAFKDVDFKNKTFIGPLSVEYFHRVKPNLSLGAIFGVGMKKEDVYLIGERGGKNGESTNYYLTLMPSLKYEWMQKKHFNLYSKIALGASFGMENFKYDDASYRAHSSHSFYVNFQASPLGIESTGEKTRFFAELGVGEQGLALVGVRFRLK